jgi:hypothetical protein
MPGKHKNGMIRVCQVSKYLSGIGAYNYLKENKFNSPIKLREKMYFCATNTRVKRVYAICMIMEDSKACIGRLSEEVPAEELIDPQVWVLGRKVNEGVNL